MSVILSLIATELSLQHQQVKNALDLLQQGATIPFVARYRKEKTDNLDETQLRDIEARYQYLNSLEERKQVILESIASQDKLTPALQAQIENCWQKNTLEDLYLPYKPKRRTKAAIAREKGLTELAESIQSLNHPQGKTVNLDQLAQDYSSIPPKEALEGVSDIIAEEIASKAEVRTYLRDYLSKEARFTTTIKSEHPEGSTKYEMYRNFGMSVAKIAPHQLLAMFRGENEGILTLGLDYDQEVVLSRLAVKEIKTKQQQLREFYQEIIKDSWKRLIEPSLIREIRADGKQKADLASVETFAANLKQLLLAPPAGMKPTLGVDPGLRTGCKLAILSETGKFCQYQVIYPHSGSNKRAEAANLVKDLLNQYRVELIAIGNGTASRETAAFISEVLETLTHKPEMVIVSEAGASIYSASVIAKEEFPDLDVTIRGAISIGRRLQDPLAELVKIDPKSIGVGQYQHDVDQKLLRQKLTETVESCVNYVGVDLNTASKELLSYVSGINPSLANNIVKYRESNGAFLNRRELLKVPKLGNKAFEQAAGFLRIRNGNNPLDNTAVHPESYPVVERILASLNVPLTQISKLSSETKKINLEQFVTPSIGLFTLQDVWSELEKPGRDPRSLFQSVDFKPGIKEIQDVEAGMELTGVVANVVNFGAFVDIGVHQDGLVHISELADYFVRDPQEVVKVGQIVKVKVLEVNLVLKRISLSLKQ
ncbi:Tex family protein [Gloeocapsa sp. PCC 73106]|uniref:Tex family protein n=1 Tax=Gloeocapsa sp. PCC 73106 TaxID=102232 RepID=UPI0002ABDFFF|nr:Tex family protein [Gloeocapsa sp. PCC 73106]ELR99262.1 transcriptional accessory protein [Gloeocapsa sp. PCC 73106]